MNYIKLQLGGKERGAKLGLGFLRKVIEHEKIDMQTIFTNFEKDTLMFLPKLIFYSLAYNCERSNEKVDFKLGDVYDWIDDVGINSDEVVKYVSAFAESVKVHFPNNEETGNEKAPKGAKK